MAAPRSQLDDRDPSHPPEATAHREGGEAFTSISTRIIFFVFLSTFMTALVVSWIAIDTIHRGLRSELEARFPAVLERHATELEHHLREQRQALAARAHAELGPLLGRRSASRHLAKAVAGILEQEPWLTGLVLVGSDGRPLASAGRAPDPLPPPAAQSGLLTTPEDPLLLVVGPTSASGALEGGPRLIAAVALGSIGQWLALGLDEGPGRMLLVRPDGEIVLHGPDSVRSDPPEAKLPLERLMLDGAARLSEFSCSHSGEHMLGAARPLDSIDWVLVVEARFDEVFAPVLSVVKRIFVSDLVVIVLFSLLAYKITAAIMQPIEALSEGAARISHGDVEHEIPTPRTQDEIGLLTRTFNDMMRKLRQSQAEIEQDKRRLTEQNEELQSANEVLAQLSITDGLTKLHNHRYFQDHLTREIKRLGRTGDDLSMILIDLDDFKRLNDRHGHAAGDEVLTNIAHLMSDSIRESDLLARYGGEEFVILAPGTDLEGAIAIAEKIRMTIEATSQIIDDSLRPVRVTVSCGVAQYRGDRKSFFQAADRALYRAKADGKNSVVAEPVDESDADAEPA